MAARTSACPDGHAARARRDRPRDVARDGPRRRLRAEDDGFAALDERAMEQIVIQDMKALESVRLAGASTRGKDKVSLDLVLTSRGDCSGRVTQHRSDRLLPPGRRDDVRPRQPRLLAGQRGLPAGGRTGPVPRGRQVGLVPSASGFGTFCDIDDFMREFRTDARGHRRDKEVTTVGEVSEVDGRRRGRGGHQEGPGDDRDLGGGGVPARRAARGVGRRRGARAASGSTASTTRSRSSPRRRDEVVDLAAM